MTEWPDSGPSGMPHRGLLPAAPAGPVQAHSPSASIALPTPPDLSSYFLIFIKFEPFVMVCHPSSTPFSLFPLPPFPLLSLLSHPCFIPFLISVNLKDWGLLFFPSSVWMGLFFSMQTMLDL